MKKTKKAYEAYLNDLYAVIINNYDIAQERFGHLAKTKQLSGRCHPLVVKYYDNMSLGTLIRKRSPVEFQCGFQEWQPQ